jgi:hypothetical protein
MAKKRINGEGTVWYVASEKRYRAQYPAGGKRRTISGKTRREVELKLRDALAKRDTNTLEKSRKDSDTVEDFLLFWVSAKTDVADLWTPLPRYTPQPIVTFAPSMVFSQIWANCHMETPQPI